MTVLEIPSHRLNDGNQMPGIGMGCWMGSVGGGDEAAETTKIALKFGYRHLDTAAAYGNEEAVGRVIRESGIPRNEIFVTTKLAGPDHGSVLKGFEASLEALGLDYIDLYLMHWPQAVDPADSSVLQPEEHPTFVETWLEMENLKDSGRVRSIGVSNFSIQNLEILLPKVNIVPAVNQIELHPCLPSSKLVSYCKEKGIVVTGYTPLGRPGAPFYSDPVFTSLAAKYQVSVAQVLLAWAIQNGTIPIPKSSNEGRALQNITLTELLAEDIAEIGEFHKKPGMHRTLCFMDKPGDGIFGWTYKQLGWDMVEGGFVNS